ncbi:MAG: type III polyketide synthase [Zetaproteobacteria bacterium]|nr:type III polyketide synthase [Zetaproteobacteria bacterium]
MKIVSVGTALPENYYPQDEILRFFREHFWDRAGVDPDQLQRIADNVQVAGRYFAVSLEQMSALRDFGQANRTWLDKAVQLGGDALLEAFERSSLCADEIRTLVSTTVTGIATPTLEARLMNRLQLPSQIRRVPLFGLGCVAGVAGIARVSDYLRAYPAEVGVLLSVELCLLTLQRDDVSVENFIGSSLFGDGAAAVTLMGAQHPAYASLDGPRVLATRSIFYPDTEAVMGWDVRPTGFKLLLSPQVPQLVREHLRQNVECFLAEQGLGLSDIASYVCHPGGPKVLQAIEESLQTPAGALQVTWGQLKRCGNLSSASVLFVLRETMERRRPPQGSYGLMIALGPGFCSELVLLQW